MISFKRVLFILIIGNNIVWLSAMERKQAAGLLELYPIPNIANSWFARAFGCNQARAEAHRRAIKQACRKRDAFKVEALTYVYEGYKQAPFSFWFRDEEQKRQQRGKKLLNTALESKRNDLAFLLLAHLADDNDHALIQLAASSACPQEAIMLLCEQGVDIDAMNAKGYTPLGSFACMGRRSLVNTLLSCGADVNCGYSPLPQIYQSKTRKGHKMISLLVANGATIDASNGDIEIDEFNQVLEGTVFHHAIESGDQRTLRMLLQKALFEPTKTEIVARQKRIFTTLCLFNRLKLARDIQFLLLSNMPEEVCTKNHAVMLLHKGVSLEQLVPHCRFSWLKQISQEASHAQRSVFLEKLVPVIVQHRMGKVAELLSSKQLLDLYSLNILIHRFKRLDIDPTVLAVLDPAQVEQHRAGIEQNVRNALL